MFAGVMSAAKTTNHAEGGENENEAATKIQAAYRGHTVRQYARTEPSHKTSTRRHKHSKVSELVPTATRDLCVCV